MRVKLTLILILATVIYAVIGGVIFHYIEQGYERELLPQILQELSQYTTDVNVDACLNWTDFIRLKAIAEDLKDGGYYISSSGQLVSSNKWDVRTSIFAAISVFTSIGYHRLAPDYTWARVFCIFYGWFGIPLFYSAIKTYDKLGGRGIRVIGRRVCRRTVTKRTGWIIAYLVTFVIGFVLFIIIPAVIFSHLERWSYAESIYFCFSTLFTIGFGDYTPGFNQEVLSSEEFMQWYRLATGFWVLILLTWFLSYVFNIISLIDGSCDQFEIMIDKRLAQAKEIHESEAEAKWAHGTTVMIRGDVPPSMSGPVNLPVAFGSPVGKPAHTGGLVSVIALDGRT